MCVFRVSSVIDDSDTEFDRCRRCLMIAVLTGGHDRTRSLRLDVHNRAFTVGGFSPRVPVAREQRDSNAQLHDHERVFGELSFVRLF